VQKVAVEVLKELVLVQEVLVPRVLVLLNILAVVAVRYLLMEVVVVVAQLETVGMVQTVVLQMLHKAVVVVVPMAVPQVQRQPLRLAVMEVRLLGLGRTVLLKAARARLVVLNVLHTARTLLLTSVPIRRVQRVPTLHLGILCLGLLKIVSTLLTRVQQPSLEALQVQVD